MLKSHLRAKWGGQIKAAEALGVSQSTMSRVAKDPHCTASRPIVELRMGLPVLQVVLPPALDPLLEPDRLMTAKLQAACRRLELAVQMLWERSDAVAVPGPVAAKVLLTIEDSADIIEEAGRDLMEDRARFG